MEIFKTNNDIEPETIESIIKEENTKDKKTQNKKTFIDDFFFKDN